MFSISIISRVVPNFAIVQAADFSSHTQPAPSPKYRRRRSINNGERQELPHKISITFRAFGEVFKLHLKQNSRLLSSTFVVKEELLGNDIIDDSLITNSKCYYHGYLESHQNSTAAISMCDGMVTS